MVDYFYGENMTRGRFLHIRRFLHFADIYRYYMEGTMGSICPQAEVNINKK